MKGKKYKSINEVSQLLSLNTHVIRYWDNVEIAKKYDLNDQKELNYINEKTENELIKRGFLEAIFGGIGKQKLPNNLN